MARASSIARLPTMWCRTTQFASGGTVTPTFTVELDHWFMTAAEVFACSPTVGIIGFGSGEW